MSRHLYRERRYTPPRGSLGRSLDDLHNAKASLGHSIAHLLGLTRTARACTRWYVRWWARR